MTLPADDPRLDEAARWLIDWVGWDDSEYDRHALDLYRPAIRYIAAILASEPLLNAPESLELHEKAWDIGDAAARDQASGY